MKYLNFSAIIIKNDKGSYVMIFNKEVFPGARIYKSLIAVLLSLLISRYFFNTPGFWIAITVILSMRDRPEETKRYGKGRTLGTIMGGLLGYLVLLFIRQTNIDQDSLIMIFVNLFGVFLLLWSSKLMKSGEVAASMGCVVFFSITLVRFTDPILEYVIERVTETIIGVIIATVVNKMDLEAIYNKRKLSNRKKKNDYNT